MLWELSLHLPTIVSVREWYTKVSYLCLLKRIISGSLWKGRPRCYTKNWPWVYAVSLLLRAPAFPCVQLGRLDRWYLSSSSHWMDRREDFGLCLYISQLFILHQLCLIMYILERLWRALLRVSSPGKELEIKKKSTYTHLCLFFCLYSPSRKPARTLWIKDDSVNTSHIPIKPPLLHEPPRER